MLLRHDDNTSCESCQRRRTAPACTARTFLARPIFVPTQDGESEQRKSASQWCTHSERCKSKHRSKNNKKKEKRNATHMRIPPSYYKCQSAMWSYEMILKSALPHCFSLESHPFFFFFFCCCCLFVLFVSCCCFCNAFLH